ncbi:MAG: hypothetical protein D6775_02940 [Caldilineae bacterium]|nr:MAG: hypothetical protein D6775_02940 [Caldilineae bacterium]
MFARLLTEPGLGGLIVLAALVLCLSFYGSLILWIARARPTEEATQAEGWEPHYEHTGRVHP